MYTEMLISLDGSKVSQQVLPYAPLLAHVKSNQNQNDAHVVPLSKHERNGFRDEIVNFVVSMVLLSVVSLDRLIKRT